MKTLSKLTIDDLEKNKPFSTFPELQTEYRIKKIKRFLGNEYFLQFKDNYRIFAIIKTPFYVWRFVPNNPGPWKRFQCPVVHNKLILMPFVCITNNLYSYKSVNYYTSILKKFVSKYPNIDFYLDELTREYRKENDKTEYL